MAISRKDFREAGNQAEDIERIKLEQKRLFEQMSLVIMVLLIGFFGMAVGLGAIMVEGFRSKEASYTDLSQTIQQENNRLDTITKGLVKYQIIPAE